MGSNRSIILILFSMTLFASAVIGANTHLDISVQETVNQNVTYAKNFWLTENQTYLLIEGVLTVSNPSTETVFDTDLEFTNVDNLVSDIIYVSGRNGTQVRFPQIRSLGEYNKINKSWQAILSSDAVFASSFPAAQDQDIDDDDQTDYIKVNSTHLLLNLSSQNELFAIRLTNKSGDYVDIRNAGTTAVGLLLDNVNITSTNIGADPTQYFGTIYINGTTNTDNEIDVGIPVNITDYKYEYAVLHVPELKGGQSTTFAYNISGTINPPLDIDTNYTHTFNRKVLAGKRFTVDDTVTNIVGILQNVTNINITIIALNISWDGKEYNFTLLNLSSTGDYSNVSQISNKTWYWTPNGGTLEALRNENITYQVKAPYSVPSTDQYPAVKQILSYQVAYAASNITLTKVWSRANINFTVSKQIVQPADNNLNRNVTWKSIPKVGARENITYNLQKVTLWVTTGLDPNQDTGLSKTYTNQGEFNISQAWTGGQSTPWYFNFTDGSEAAYPPPIVWIKPYWVISNAYNQITNQSYTVNGTDIYIKYIYVINGYWLEVDKNVTSIADNRYLIYTWVHNKGNGWTPINMTVTVYDFVPDSFRAYNFSIAYNNNSNVAGQFTGTAYKWDVGLKAPMNSSLAPDDGADGGDDEWTVTYMVNGTGDYVVSDLYIVGLDPIKVDGASASPVIAVFTAVKSHTKEVIYAAIVVFLILLNTVNLLMTSRINKKLDSKSHHHSSEIRSSIEELKKK